MSEYEISADEKVYVPDLWIEEAPICPIHDEELYEMPCCRSYKDRKVSFTGYFCEKCNKIMVRRAYIDELQDQCATIGVPVIGWKILDDNSSRAFQRFIKSSFSPFFV